MSGFDFDDVESVRRDIGADLNAVVAGRLSNALSSGPVGGARNVDGQIQRIGEVPIYQTDAIVRRASSLQKTRDAARPVAGMNGALLQRLDVQAGDDVCLQMGEGSVVLKAVQDDNLPHNCLRVAAGHPLTAALGAMFGAITVERIAKEKVA